MAQFKAFSADVEVLGEVVLSFINVMGAFRSVALGVLADHGITDPVGTRWYSQQAWLDSFKTIAEKVGPNTLYQIGRQIPEQANFPPGLDSVDKVLSDLDRAYQISHRGGEAGHYDFKALGMNTGRMICNNPYPCEFDRGVIQALAQRFEPPGAMVSVRHEDLSPCKKLGAESCTYIVTW